MQRLFGKINNGNVCLSNEDLHHLLDVKRYKVGEKLEVVDGDEVYLCELTSFNPFSIKTIEKLDSNRELNIKINLAFSLLKGDHNSLIVEKCTELGTYKFYPFVSDRCIIKISDDDSKRCDRLSKIVKGASEQSRRNFVPVVENTKSFKEILHLNIKNKIIAYEGEAGSSKTLLNYLKENKMKDEVLVLVGPEGGFSENEVKLAKETGFTFISLGKTILRGETACIASSAIIAAYDGENND